MKYILANLGMSTNFGDVDLQHLSFPAIMRIDWIRVYQPKNAINIGCSPADFPTAAYISQYVTFPVLLMLTSFLQIHRGIYEPKLDDLDR